LSLIDAVNKIEETILDGLSKTDRAILKIYVEQQLTLATNKEVQDGLKKILKTFSKGFWDFEDTPHCMSVEIFGKDMFALTPFQYRVAFLQDVVDKVKEIFDWEIYPNLPENKILLFMVERIFHGFENILGSGINFKGLPNNDSYYEEHVKEYKSIVELHKEFVKENCLLLRDLFAEIDDVQ
jgi:hypothetical protein